MVSLWRDFTARVRSRSIPRHHLTAAGWFVIIPAMPTTYISPEGVIYDLHETKFINPANGLETVLFVLTNESGAVVRTSASSWDVRKWVDEHALLLT